MVGVTETITINNEEYNVFWNGHGLKDWSKLDNIVNKVIALTKELKADLNEFHLSFEDKTMDMNVLICKTTRKPDMIIKIEK